jgi:HlyD family secretion protein
MSFLCALPFLAGLIGGCAPPPLAVGYVEGDFVLLAPIEVVQVDTMKVARGDRVARGDTIAILESSDAEIAVAQANAALAQAEAQLADLKVGKRPEEIAVLEATLKSAEAQRSEAERVLARTTDLHARNIATQADLDSARTQAEQAEAAVGQAEANLAVARLPARDETIRAAEKQRDQAQASLEAAEWKLSKRVLLAPSAGVIDDLIRREGDLAGPSAPVVSLLPDGGIRLKLYVGERDFSRLNVGDVLDVRCDGCGEGLKAHISYISPDPEFTPPVIYSLESRQKLVYLVEARPDGDARALKPGQIVDVSLPGER